MRRANEIEAKDFFQHAHDAVAAGAARRMGRLNLNAAILMARSGDTMKRFADAFVEAGGPDPSTWHAELGPLMEAGAPDASAALFAKYEAAFKCALAALGVTPDTLFDAAKKDVTGQTEGTTMDGSKAEEVR